MWEPYQQKASEVLREMRVQPEAGLSLRAVQQRRERFGENVLPTSRGRSAWLLFLDRFRDILVLVLLGAAFVSFLLGREADTFIIFAALFLDVTLSFIQVWRTEQTLKEINEHVQPFATVLREGVLRSITAHDLVVGDIIEIRAGERVPADGRLFQVSGLTMNESALTGEVDDVAKSMAVQRTRVPLSNRRNMVYLGTGVVNGIGRAVVVATGARTEFGKIAQVLKANASPPSPLRRKLQQTGLQIGLGIVAAVGVLFVAGLLRGQHLLETSLTATTLVVSAIPEDLTMILTIALTVGVTRILRKKGAVRSLEAGETLGSATVICTDKTGTLTYGQMSGELFDFLNGTQVQRESLPERFASLRPLERLAWQGLALASDAHAVVSERGEVTYAGAATERAALSFAEHSGIDQQELRSTWRQRAAISFSSRWKYRATLHDHPTQATRYLFVVGAPEVLLERSSSMLSNSQEAIDFTSEARFAVERRLTELAQAGYRLLGVAIRRHVNLSEIHHADIQGLLFLGVLALRDAIRRDVPRVVAETLAAGVAIKLVTGDHPETARQVAHEIGLPESDVVTSSDLEQVAGSELRNLVAQTHVFARITPLDKQRIVRALQERGEVVAMTGDGINDAVALKGADIGVAMGTGRDIAREAADLVLLDDSFATIVAAIREGRVLRDNVRKVIGFLLATNGAEVGIFFVSLLAGWPLPLLPAQILWVNLVTDGTSDIALSLEPAERGVMQRRPEDPGARLIDWRLASHILAVGLIVTVAAMGLYWYLLQQQYDIVRIRTMSFTFLSLISLLSVWSFRSLNESIYRRGILGNPWVPVSLAVSAGLQVAAIYWPPLQRVFDTVPLTRDDLLLVALVAVVAVIIIDLRKLVLTPLWKTHEARAALSEKPRLAPTSRTKA